jgi:hypothetical protein
MTTVYWREAYLGAGWPLFASLELIGSVFATVSRVEVPAPGWCATIRHRGWERRLQATFTNIVHAQQAVERWAAAHDRAIRDAMTYAARHKADTAHSATSPRSTGGLVARQVGAWRAGIKRPIGSDQTERLA